MSAVNVIIDGREAHLITDGAAVLNKRLMSVRTKVLPLAHLGAAVACRGRLGLAQWLMFHVSMYSSFANLRTKLAEDLRMAYGWKVRAFPWAYNFDVVIVGTQKGQPVAFSISSAAHPGYKRFELVDIDFLYATPQPQDNVLEDVASDRRRDIAGSTEHLDRQALAILSSQRSSGIVGGFAQITSVGGRGVYTRIIKRWSDPIGKRIAD